MSVLPGWGPRGQYKRSRTARDARAALLQIVCDDKGQWVPRTILRSKVDLSDAVFRSRLREFVEEGLVEAKGF